MKPFIVPLFIPHHGCPSRCLYCNQEAATGAGPAISDAELTQTVREWLARKRADIPPDRTQIAYYGGSFTSLPIKEQERLLSLARPFVQSGEVGSIRISARPDAFTEEKARLLWEHGVRTVELGVQSLDRTVLQLSGRGYNPFVVEKTVGMLRALGFQIGFQLMPGLPGDTRDTFERTTEETAHLRPDFARIYPTVVLKGSPLEKEFHQGKFSPLSLEEAVEWCAGSVSRLRGAGIRVIRVGLQATGSIREGGDVIAGPFHPAFGELVESRIALDELSEAFKKSCFPARLPQEGVLLFRVPRNRLSIYRGQRNSNLAKLKIIFGREFDVRGDPAAREGEITFFASLRTRNIR